MTAYRLFLVECGAMGLLCLAIPPVLILTKGPWRARWRPLLGVVVFLMYAVVAVGALVVSLPGRSSPWLWGSLALGFGASVFLIGRLRRHEARGTLMPLAVAGPWLAMWLQVGGPVSVFLALVLGLPVFASVMDRLITRAASRR